APALDEAGHDEEAVRRVRGRTLVAVGAVDLDGPAVAALDLGVGDATLARDAAAVADDDAAHGGRAVEVEGDSATAPRGGAAGRRGGDLDVLPAAHGDEGGVERMDPRRVGDDDDFTA